MRRARGGWPPLRLRGVPWYPEADEQGKRDERMRERAERLEARWQARDEPGAQLRKPDRQRLVLQRLGDEPADPPADLRAGRPRAAVSRSIRLVERVRPCTEAADAWWGHDLLRRDVEVARLVRKDVRTVQRWCVAGKLPGAYKAGRSWRIPTDALINAGLGGALQPDTLEAHLATAQAVVDQLIAELDESARRKQPPIVAREWDSIATSARKLGSASKRLAQLAELAEDARQRFEA
jgi:hypothetical protein